MAGDGGRPLKPGVWIGAAEGEIEAIGQALLTANHKT